MQPSRAVARLAVLGVLGTLLALLPASAAHAELVLQDGFSRADVATGGFTVPTAFARTPDGRLLVAEKAGRLRVVPAGATTPLPGAVLDIRAQVNSPVDRGLLGLAVDKDFATNHWVYLLYTLELYATLDTEQPVVSRLTRVTLGNDNTVGPETVILGTEDGDNVLDPPGTYDTPCPNPADTLDCMPADYRWHVIGTVISDPTDGTLWVGSGDTHSQTSPDDTTFRPYQETNTAGKILHIDRDGNGLAGHPFCPTQADLTRTCTKLYAKGFRNPFRFTLRPGGGLVAGDVGSSFVEEINLVQSGGNYGWPCYEGSAPNPLYKTDTTCTALYAQGAGVVRTPAYEYAHGDGASALAGPVYTGGAYPSDWVGDVFIADFAKHFIKRLELTGDQVVAVHEFAQDVGDPAAQPPVAPTWAPVQLQLNGTGELEFLDIYGGATGPSGVRKFTYTPGNQPPTVAISANPVVGPSPLTVSLSAAGSSDPDADPLTYSWDFDDGSPQSTAISPTHQYVGDGSYEPTVTVSDGQGHAVSKSIAIGVGDNTDPVATITSPGAGATFVAGQELLLTGSATDFEDGTLPGDALSWDIVLHHGESHQHLVASPVGTDVRFTPLVDHDSDSYYEVTLTATDSAGRTDVVSRTLLPQTSQVQLASVPPGAPIFYGEAGELTAPVTRTSTVGYRPSITAAEKWTDAGGQEWVFESWSDLGSRQHDISVPSLPNRYVAHYRSAGPAETVAVTPVADTWVDSAVPAQTTGGTATQLLVDAGGAVPAPQVAYLRFDLSSLGCRRIRSARLRLTQVQYSPRGGQVHRVLDNAWSEATTSWSTRPALEAPVLGTFGIVTTPNKYEVGLDASTVGAGLTSFGIDSIEYDGARWGSRESGTPPQLLVTLDPTTDVGESAATDPIQYSGSDRLARTAGGRLLSAYSPASGGVQLAWSDGGATCDWSTATTGSVPSGRIAAASRGRQTAALLVGPGASGAQSAWVAYAPPAASTSRQPLRLRRLTDLDDPAGPVVGPEFVLDSPLYGAVRPDLALESTASGPQVAVLWVRRTTERTAVTSAAWLPSVTIDKPALVGRTSLLTSRDVPRPGVLATTALGVRALIPTADGQLRVWTHSSSAARTAWTAAAVAAGTATASSSPSVRVLPGVMLVATDSALGVRVSRLDDAVTTTTTELTLGGYRNPVIVGDASRSVLVMRRTSDGAIVSRTRAADGTWTTADSVELATTNKHLASWPAALVAAGRLHLLVPGDRSGSVRRLSAWQRAF